MVPEERPLVKRQGIDVVDTGKKIQNWLIQTNAQGTKFQEITQKFFEVISRVTGIEETSIPAINYVGLGRLMIKFNNEVFFGLLQ